MLKICCYYFLLYFMYCVLGYILECSFCSICDKKIVLNRGFLVGPYLPIYGKGAICIIILLKKYLNDPVALFIMASIIAIILEYIASYLMEKIFKARWWDYSNRKFNINGRVCLSNGALFGIGGLIIMYVINPFFTNILNHMSSTLIIVLGIFFFLIYETDTFISITTTYKLRKNSILLRKDSTEEIRRQINASVKNNYFKKRLLNAFPRLKDSVFFNQINHLKDKLSIK